MIVNLQNRCMCVPLDGGGRECFEIGIGRTGPSMTASGVGKIGEANGAKYQTKPGASTGYDNDALAMGIGDNDAVGKWIHKPKNCAPARSYRTKGCIAVDCDKWPLVKKQMGKQIAVCGGAKNTGKIRKNSSQSSVIDDSDAGGDEESDKAAEKYKKADEPVPGNVTQ